LIDCQQQTHPLSSSSSLYGKKTCKKEQEEGKKISHLKTEEEEDQNIIKIKKSRIGVLFVGL
jgi:hypothetical protein